MVDTAEPPEEVMQEDSFIMPSIPQEIIVNILSLLPVKSILRFRCVCKHWNELFKDRFFIKNHHKHAIEQGRFTSIMRKNHRRHEIFCGSPLLPSTSYECPIVKMNYPFRCRPIYNDASHTTHIVGSCNGLVLMKFVKKERRLWLAKFTDSGLFLWNPSTKEYKLLPQTVIRDHYKQNVDTFRDGTYNFGLGYNGVIDDYKIIRIDVFSNYGGTVCYGCRVNVYTLGSNSWKALPNIIPYDICMSGPNRTKPALVNGSLHWLGVPVNGLGIRTLSRVIVSFDLENDTCTEVPVNQQLGELLLHDSKADSIVVSPFDDVLLSSLDGFLCILGGFKTRNYIMNIEIWVMKDYGDRQSWTKDLCVTRQSIDKYIKMFSPTEFMDFMNGEVLFMRSGVADGAYGVSLLGYDPKHGTSRLVRIQDVSADCVQLETYVESLVSLNSGTFLRR
ncbi:hypothetical protein MKX03_015870 [Papaver bracteatum]|nr:hypothetical protein MKX03_015870 [Papaver bracteatum]